MAGDRPSIVSVAMTSGRALAVEKPEMDRNVVPIERIVAKNVLVSRHESACPLQLSEEPQRMRG